MLSRSKIGRRPPIAAADVGVHDADISGGDPPILAPGGVPGELAPDEKMLPMPLSFATDEGDVCGPADC